MKYDFLIVGAGLTGATIAHQLNKQGYKVLVVDKRSHVGGNVYTEQRGDVCVHKYGAHIFHTSNKEVWEFIKQFDTFNNYIHQPLAKFKKEYYNLPFNMWTFSKLFSNSNAAQCQGLINEEARKYNIDEPKNLEQHAIKTIGTTIYKTLVKGYTEKQWGRSCRKLRPEILKRIPLRWEYNNNYFNDKYQGIPTHGYTYVIEQMLKDVPVILGYNFLDFRHIELARKVIYTGPIDEYYNYCFGALEYRSLKFKEEIIQQTSYQPVSVVNYTERKIPYTRIIEHRKFLDMNSKNPVTVITKEYPQKYKAGKNEPYYPVNNEKNDELYRKYAKLAKNDSNIMFCGRLGSYKYMDMDDCIEEALKISSNILSFYLR